MKETAGQIEMWLRNAETNQELLKGWARPWRQVRIPPGFPVTVAGAGISLAEALYQMDRSFIVGNQSSAPYLMYRNIKVGMVVIADGGPGTMERLGYVLAQSERPEFVVSTFVHPPLLRELVDKGFPVAYFVHGSEDHPDMTQKLVDLAPPEEGEVECVAQLGSVVNASVVIADALLGRNDERALYLGGVDFGYPRWPLLRIPDIVNMAGYWIPGTGEDGGVPIKVFGYRTTAQHIEYYNMLKFVVSKLDRKVYTIVDGILNDFMETGRVE